MYIIDHTHQNTILGANISSHCSMRRMQHNVKGLAPDYMCELFESVQMVSSRNTRSNARDDLYVPRARTQLFQSTLTISGANIWNKLSTALEVINESLCTASILSFQHNVMILTISLTLVGANHLQRTHSMHSELPICLRLNRKPSLQRSSQFHRSSNYKPIIIMPPVTLYWLQIANITHSVGAGWFNDFWMSVRPGWVSSRNIHMGPGKNVYSGQESLGFFFN